VTIDVNPPSGTRDLFAADVRLRRRTFAAVQAVFEAHGFEPLDTPAFERLEVLSGKYGEEGEQLIFRILRRGEQAASGEADLALRYDLTVPLARVVARYGSQLPDPFKRHQIANVWRADRPGRGRFREFTQCDIDVAGSSSPLADASVLLAVLDALDALGLGDVTVHLNDRDALHGLVAAYGVPEALGASALTALDKLAKVGPDGVAAELRQRGVPDAAVAALHADLAGEDRVAALTARVASDARGRGGLDRIDVLWGLLPDAAAGRVVHDPVLARGLGYYTGPVFEVTHPALDASIAAGGRYDGLVGMFSGGDVPAVGGSLGLERILLILAERSAAEAAGADAPDVLVTVLDPADGADLLAVAGRLRTAGVRADVWTGDGRLGKQLRHADRRGIPFALVRGEAERAAGSVTLKQLATGEQTTVAEADAPALLLAARAAAAAGGPGAAPAPDRADPEARP
jgi:histidyl-tRNA synthetase